MISTRLIALLALAASLPLSESEVLDVWVPLIIEPNERTTWYGGSYQNVIWYVDTLNAVLTHKIMFFTGMPATPLPKLPTLPAQYISSRTVPSNSVGP